MVTIWGLFVEFRVNFKGLGLELSVEGNCEELKVKVRVSLTGYW